LENDALIVEYEPSEISRSEWDAIVEKGAVREALLAQKLPNGRVQCNICQRRCKVPEWKAGYCKTKVNVGGVLYTTIYGVVSSAAADPIEKKPVFHYKPGSLCYSVGSLGCNFRCVFCQNWQIAFADSVQLTGMCQYVLSPQVLVQNAVQTGCKGIAWTYNEPGIWLNYTFDSAQLARKEGLYTVYVTNGYATDEHLDTIGPYLDVYRVDIKSMEDGFYQKLIKVPSAKGILDTAKRAKQKWNMHLECVTNVIPGWNDSEENLRSIARWIADNLGELTPWHITRFFPHADMQNVPPTPHLTLTRAVEIGREEGLKFVYLGNIATATGQNTYCYKDGKLAVERVGFGARIASLTQDGKCPEDGTDLNIKL
jgi:pyruvate formate lyase activating enzyme